jgi:D-sedoheptulose 7-phosphate isomerase
MSESFADQYLRETRDILDRLSSETFEEIVEQLDAVRARGGRLFVLGVGGSAAHASHAVNDFRKICGFEAYAPTDNVAELTARTNDDGWDSAFAEWLRGSRIGPDDGVLVFSVGGGDPDRNVSVNLVRALDVARDAGATIVGVVGRDGGYTARVADVCLVIPVADPARTTPHTEGLAAVAWHLLVSHPALQQSATKWESLDG